MVVLKSGLKRSVSFFGGSVSCIVLLSVLADKGI